MKRYVAASQAPLLVFPNYIGHNISFQIGNTVFSGDVIFLMYDCVLDNLPACKSILKKILHLAGGQIYLKLGRQFLSSCLVMLHHAAINDQTS